MNPNAIKPQTMKVIPRPLSGSGILEYLIFSLIDAIAKIAKKNNINSFMYISSNKLITFCIVSPSGIEVNNDLSRICFIIEILILNFQGKNKWMPHLF